jgi:hypothetical protein
METIGFSETSVCTHWSTQHHNPEEQQRHQYLHGNHRFHQYLFKLTKEMLPQLIRVSQNDLEQR